MGQPAERQPEAVADDGLDRAHLARMTFGDSALQRELLELFDRQAVLLMARMQRGEAAAVAALAHTLKGSALGVGAGAVAAAAAAVEQAPTLERIAALGAAVTRVQADIAAILR